MVQPKEEGEMKQRVKWLGMIAAGIWLLTLISCSVILLVFFPNLLYPEVQTPSEATTELFAMDTYITMTA